MSATSIGIIRGFLLRHPKPSAVRVHTMDDRTEEIPVAGRKYALVAESVQALGPELVECLDKQGKIIRAWRCEQQKVSRVRDEPRPVPDVLSTDAETARVVHIANLLAEAYKFSTTVAFEKMIELVERMSERSDSIEQRLERAEAAHRRALRDQVDLEFERAEEVAEQVKHSDSATQQQILMHLMNGMQSGQETAAAEKAADKNGKGRSS